MKCFRKSRFLRRLLPAAFAFMVCAGVAEVLGQPTILPKIETKRIDAEGLKALLPGAEKRQPVLLNFWATWCGPCHAEFPDLVEIDREYRPRGLNFSVVSVDNVSLIDTRVAQFLESYGAEMPSYLIHLPGGRREIARAVRQIAPRFRDVYPLTLLFDAQGRLVYQKIGRVNPRVLRAEIGKVLIKK
jgi:thiol-disulfide isomerase/thioredoxin